MTTPPPPREEWAPSQRTQKVDSFKVMDILGRAVELERQGRSIMHLEAGQPQTGAPLKVLETANRALVTDKLGYTPSMGIMELRERIAKHYKEKYTVSVPTSRIMVTTGSSGAFLLTFMASFDAGDRVAVASSSYPCYRNILNSLGCTVVTIPVNSEYKVTMVEVKAFVDQAHTRGEPPLKGIILSSPSNPTGTMLTPEEVQGMCQICEEQGIMFISDEIYHGITYGAKDQTALAYSSNCFVINSFSKFYSMTGWRLGWLVIPSSLVDSVYRLAQNMYLSAPTLSQLSAVAAFDCAEELEEHRLRYQRNREVLLRGFTELGLAKEVAPCNGAFYLYLDIGDHVPDSMQFASDMLEQVGVATTPGVDFEDPATDAGHRHLRLSYCGSTAEMEEAMRRIKSFWVSYKAKLPVASSRLSNL